MRSESNRTESSSLWWREYRGYFFIAFAILVFGLITVRLFWIQILNQPDFLKAAAVNRIRVEVIEPIRGKIFDRNGKLIVENRPSYTLYTYPWTVRRNRHTIDTLASVLELDRSVVRDRVALRGWYTFNPTVVHRDLSFVKMARLEVVKLDIPGIAFRLEAKRDYSYPEAVHILGYVGERSTSSKGRVGLIGKRGIEKVYEEWLGGKPGIRYLQVDATGNVTGEVSGPIPVPAQNGWDLHLNLDADLQRYAYELMDGRTGAVAAIDARDGRVLTLISVPDYDPSVFAGVLPQDVWNALQSDPDHPLLNRAVQGLYPPGSTFKMAILASGFGEEIVNEQFSTVCGGGLQIGRRFFKCWKHSGHGRVHWREAIQQSCDVFFYTLGLQLGIEQMEKYARRLSFGSKTGIDIDGEMPGLVPNPKYMDRKYGKRQWTRGQLANIAIGQGDVLVTPIQLAVYTAAIATGNIAKPRIADRLVNPVTGEIHSIPTETEPLQISDQIRLNIREGMRMVVNEPGGTAYWLRRRNIVMAGKTGTSENPHGEDHGLFVGFAPFDDPIIAVSVVVEHGEHGSTSAAPVAFKVMEHYIYSIHPNYVPK
ncbi:MAG: penicillin-binding protein 2 [Candidatus Electryoneaceae bacterium]|nr:penicillin-binding protein 2 [Candidatus Electryoneaceae bacterium]